LLRKNFLLYLLIPVLPLVNGCSHSGNAKVTRGVYYWKTSLSINQNDLKWINENHIRKMYVRFFDVDWNPNVNQAVPVSEITLESKPPERVEIIPTVFITNRTIINIADSLIKGLAQKIFGKISYKMKGFNLFPLKEIQMDCDWSTGTKDKYFQLINGLNELAVKKNISVTATIRLHQVKYFKKTGVPPVKRGMLMFYNMSDVADIRTRNSIYDEDIAKRYLVNFDKYPVPLDVVLPAFSWGVLFKNRKISRLINDVSETELTGSGSFKSLGSGYYRAEENNYLHGIFIGDKDIIRLEQITPADTKAAAELVSHYIKNDSIVVSIYHLNKETVGQYGKEVWEDITSPFN
jgi:hypothetical protein